MTMSGYIKATCKECKKSIDYYCYPIPSSDAEITYTCDKCILEQQDLSYDSTYEQESNHG